MPPPEPADSERWALEVVRGVRPDESHPLVGVEVTLGNGPADGAAFLSLAGQEGASPRRMAARHAVLARSGGGWTARDLDTPGGTFVNNRRVLPGVAQPIGPGDTIQLGSVQLRLVGRPAPSPASAPGEFAFQPSGGGTTCRGWDDFLALSAQRWESLRDDLAAGRLAEFARSVGRPDLAPPAVASTPTAEQADEALDAWLGRLPTRSPALPELDVHPLKVAIAVGAGGGTVRRKVRVANVGHRLLRARVRVEPGGGLAVTIAPEFAGRSFVVRDGVDVPVDVAIPEPLAGPLAAELVVLGAGAERRVAIVVDRRVEAAGPGPSSAPDFAAIPEPLAAFRRLPLAKRLLLGGLIGAGVRFLAGMAGGAIGADAMLASGPDVPDLGRVALAFGLLGAAPAGWWMARRVGASDALAGAAGGAGLGILLASAVVAACRAVEPALLGPLAASIFAVLGLWGAFGVALAALTSALIPVHGPLTEEPK